MSNRMFRYTAAAFLLGVGAVVTPTFTSPFHHQAIAAPQSGSRVTQALEQYLRKRISSPGGQFQLKITATPRAEQGFFQEISITAHPVEIKKMRFSQLQLRARNVHISPSALLQNNELKTLSSNTTLYAVVTADELTQALSGGKDSSVMNLSVKFKGDQIEVSGNYNWKLFSGPFTATGKLHLASGHKIVADIQSLKINGFEAPNFIKSKFSDRINPLIDYTDLPFQPPFRKLVIQGNKAIVYA